MPRIEKMFAFIAENNGDDEGVVGIEMGRVWWPLVGADMARVNSLRPVAKAIAGATGKIIKLVVFETRKEMEVISGGPEPLAG